MEWNWAKSKKFYTSAEVVCYVKPQSEIVSTQPNDPLSCRCFTAYSGYPYCYNSRALSRFSYASDRRWGRYCIVYWRFQIRRRYDSSYISTAWLSRKCQTYRCSALWYHLPQSQSTSDTFQVSGCNACAVSFDLTNLIASFALLCMHYVVVFFMWRRGQLTTCEHYVLYSVIDRTV